MTRGKKLMLDALQPSKEIEGGQVDEPNVIDEAILKMNADRLLNS